MPWTPCPVFLPQHDDAEAYDQCSAQQIPWKNDIQHVVVIKGQRVNNAAVIASILNLFRPRNQIYSFPYFKYFAYGETAGYTLIMIAYLLLFGRTDSGRGGSYFWRGERTSGFSRGLPTIERLLEWILYDPLTEKLMYLFFYPNLMNAAAYELFLAGVFLERGTNIRFFQRPSDNRK